jgi:tryptophan-rich sensory protein
MHYIIVLTLLILTPCALASAANAPTDFKSLMGNMTGIINIIIPLIFGLTFISIAWGAMKAWIMGEATQEDIERGKKVVLVGVIVLVIMTAIWGILRILQAGLFG